MKKKKRRGRRRNGKLDGKRMGLKESAVNGLSAAVSSVLKEHRTLSINWIGPSDRNTSTGKYTQFCPKNQSEFPQKDIHR